MPNSTPRSSSSAAGTLPLTASDLAELRQALTFDLGRDEAWSDDEIRAMAADTLHLLTVLRRIAAAQRQRRS